MANATMVENERTKTAQKVGRQPDGPGKRIGQIGEISGIVKLAPGGAKLFRERLPQFQAEAAYWEGRIGTVHEFRVWLIDNDTRLMYTVVYDGDFKPYFEDFVGKGAPFFDMILSGIVDGFGKTADGVSMQRMLSTAFEADFFYASHPDVSVRDTTKLQNLGQAASAFIDAAGAV